MKRTGKKSPANTAGGPGTVRGRTWPRQKGMKPNGAISGKPGRQMGASGAKDVGPNR